MTITTIGLTGYAGRMGQAIADCIKDHPGAALTGGLVRADTLAEAQKRNDALIVTDNPAELFPQCDVIVDFSHASVTPVFAKIAAEYGKPFLTGTTGLDTATRVLLEEVSAKIPVLNAPNTSLSLVVVRRMVELAARLLKDHDYDIAILDRHHRFKKDAPSGTALALGQAILNANDGAHPPSYSSLRSGSIIGEHEVMFAGPGETVSVLHSIADRRVFAKGALSAALWLAGQKPGYYTMDHVLGL